MSGSWNVLKQIAREINVTKDMSESETAWQRRVIYSICGRMMLASLWDYSDADTVSVRHMKQRGLEMLESYQLLYPSIVSESNYGIHNQDLVERMYDRFLQIGQMYHKRNYVRAASARSRYISGVSLLSGMYATDSYYLSGVGPYRMGCDDNAMQGFPFTHPLIEDLLEGYIKNAMWVALNGAIEDYEFLRTVPPFTRGYWRADPDVEAAITLLRYKNNDGPKQYYLCKRQADVLMVSALPRWINQDRNHVLLSIALLKEYEALPPVIITKRDTIAVVELPYRLPPEEEAVLNTYSWPYAYDGEDRAFKRFIAMPLYGAIKEMMQTVGFNVEER